jgi:predicted membrane-bound spermidine synthase
VVEVEPAARRTAIALSIIFFLSGASSLLLETLWFRLCGLVFGNSAWASAIVLGSFMTGLAIGNALSVRFGRSGRNPLRTYATLEFTIAGSGLLLVLFLPALSSVFAPLFRAAADTAFMNPARLILAFVLLLIPSTMMGATLPTMVSALSKSDANFGRVLGLLYGCNTLGAVFGSLIGEIVLIRVIGIRGTGFVAAAASCTAAIAALFCRRLLPPSSEEGQRQAAALHRPWRLLAAAFLCGFCVLALEVIWFRFVILYLMSTSATFAVMLAVVLAGISLGAFAASVIFQRMPDADKYTPVVAAVSVIAVVLSYMGFVPDGRGHLLIAVVIDALRLMLPVSVLSGFLFTAIGRAVQREVGDEVGAASMTTLANTIGAAIGPAAAGFLFIPSMGVERAFFLVAVAYAITALLTVRKDAPRTPLAIAGAIAAGALAMFPFGLYLREYVPLGMKNYQGGHLIALREGPTETAAYLQYNYAGEPYMHRLTTDGYSMSGTSFPSRRYMSAFVYLPLALRPEAKSALLISYGVGVTAKALQEAQQLTSIDVVDISRNIMEMGSIVWPGKSNPLADPRVHPHVEDGRFYLLSSSRKFDLITAEPPPPKRAGVVNLYTREHFQLIHDHLNEGGIASYWLPVYQLTERDSKGIIRAFCDAFSDCSLWTGAGAEWILLGTRGGAPPTVEGFSRQWNVEPSRRQLQRIGIESPQQLAATFLLDAPMLHRFAGTTPPVTDNYPLRLTPEPAEGTPAYVELVMNAAPLAFGASDYVRRTIPAEMRAEARRYFAVERLMDRALAIAKGDVPLPTPETLRTILTSNKDLHAATRLLFGSDAWLEDIARRRRAQGDRDPRFAYILAVGELSDHHFAEAAALFGEAAQGMPNDPRLQQYKALAESLQQ